jgi:hypothetical protein
MHNSWKSRGGGPWVFLANSFEGGTWGCEKISEGSCFNAFLLEVFQKSLKGVHEVPPLSPPPVCIYESINIFTVFQTFDSVISILIVRF